MTAEVCNNHEAHQEHEDSRKHMQTPPSQVKRISPMLAAEDMGVTLDFYTKILRFEVEMQSPTYAVVSCDNATIHFIDRPQVFEPPRVLVWELVMGCIWIAVEAGPTEGGRRPTGVGAAVSWAA